MRCSGKLMKYLLFHFIKISFSSALFHSIPKPVSFAFHSSQPHFIQFPGLFHNYQAHFISPRLVSFCSQVCFIYISFLPGSFHYSQAYFIPFPGLFHLCFISPSLISFFSQLVSLLSRSISFVFHSFQPILLISRFISFSFQVYFICISLNSASFHYSPGLFHFLTRSISFVFHFSQPCFITPISFPKKEIYIQW